jgi:putative intracellular protease/amidase
MAEILFIMTGADAWTLKDGTRHPTGFWAEEAVVPLEAFKAAGHRVTTATPGGVQPPVDAASLTADANGGEEGSARVRAAIATAPEFHRPADLAAVDLADYDAVFVPGGHGPMEDLAADADAGRLLTGALAAGKPIGVVCHGPAALLAAVGDDGANAFAGYRVAAFTNEEERRGGLADRAPWLLQDRLAAAGLAVVAGEPFAAHVEIDRDLVTGQNPASSEAAAAALLERIG